MDRFPVDALALALEQYGLVGGVAGASVAAVAWMTRRYITHLERSEERHIRAEERHIDALRGVTGSLSHSEQQAAVRHEQVMGELRLVRHERRGPSLGHLERGPVADA